MVILISECLLGVDCRYDGRTNACPDLWQKLREHGHTIVPVCPEQLGGLSTPRPPVEWQGGRAMNIEGKDCTEAFLRGAEQALKVSELYGCELAILKAHSPSCGTYQIYDGTFSDTLTEGNGATAELLLQKGIKVIDEDIAMEMLEKGQL